MSVSKSQAPVAVPFKPYTDILSYPALIDCLNKLPMQERRGHIQNLCLNDVYFLVRYILRREDTEVQWILDRCREVEAAPDGFLDLWAREHYKSTVITYGLTIRDILRDPEITVGIFAHTRPIAKSFLRQIKQELETNERLKKLFPDILYDQPKKQSPKWSEDEGLVVKRAGNPKEATVEAWGLIDGMPTGKHFRLRVYDDVVTEKSVTTPEMIKKTTNAWELSLNLGVDGGAARYIGTRYHDADTYGAMIERDAAVPRLHPATEDGTAGGNPVLFSGEYLQQRRRDLSPYNFSCQLLLDPIPDEDSYFPQRAIRYYDWHKLPGSLVRYGASDYATRHGEGDYTVHGVIGVDQADNIYVIDLYREQALSDEWVEAVIGMMRKYKPRHWAEERGQILNTVGPFLKKRMREENVWTPRSSEYGKYTPASKKDERAQSIRGRMLDGKVFIPHNAPWSQDLVAELLRFPYGQHDDQVDVLSLFGLMLDDMGKAARYKKPEKARGRTIDDIDRAERLGRLGIRRNVGYYAGTTR
jgi:predicted phage terminase large subunit-like protein